MKVGIVGLGLIGGSFAKAYHAAGWEVLAADIDRQMLDFAMLQGAVNGELTEDAQADCDLILIAVYPRAAVEYLQKHGAKIGKKPVVIDCCGTKRVVCEACFPLAEQYGFTYLGGHPMAGTHNSGFNDDEIPALAGLTRAYPVDVRFIEWMPMGQRPPGAYPLDCGAVLNALPELTALPPDGGVAERYILPGAQGYVGLIRPVSCQFCAGCNRLRLTADGKLKPCLHSGQEFSVRGLDDAAMRAQFLRAIREKPAQHAPLDLAHQSEAGRNMNEIGG